MTPAGRIVIVEDNEDLQFLVRFHLVDAGCTDIVHVRDDWDRLFEPTFWEGVSAAVVDLYLGPRCSGVDVLCWLMENAPHVRRVVFTASVMADGSEAHRQAEALGDTFVSKNADAADLVKAVLG